MISKSIKTLGCLTLLLLGFAFTGCDLFSSENESPTVEGFGLKNQSSGATLSKGQQYTITGKLEDDTGIDKVEITITGGDKPVTLSISQDYKNEKKWDYDKDDNKQVITIPADLAAGTYKLEIEVSDADGSSSSSSFEFKIEGTEVTPDVEAVSKTLGAQSASEGSAIDLDAMTVYTKADAKANDDKVDLLFQSKAGGTKPTLVSPKEAKTDGYSYVDGWGTLNDTKFYKTDKSAADFDAIKTQAEIDAIWNAGSGKSELEEPASSDVIIAKTNAGKIVLIKVESLSNADNAKATITIKGYKAK